VRYQRQNAASIGAIKSDDKNIGLLNGLSLNNIHAKLTPTPPDG